MRPILACTFAVALLAAGCAYEVIDLGEQPLALPAIAQRLPLTVTVRAGSFDASRLSPEGVTQHFAELLRDSGLVDGVIHPPAAGLDPLWEIELAARDEGKEADANFWKAIFGHAFPPTLVFLHFENDYALDLEALLVRRRQLVTSYRAHAVIRHRYQWYANRLDMERDALASLARRATQAILAQIASDAERLRAEDLARTGR